MIPVPYMLNTIIRSTWKPRTAKVSKSRAPNRLPAGKLKQASSPRNSPVTPKSWQQGTVSYYVELDTIQTGTYHSSFFSHQPPQPHNHFYLHKQKIKRDDLRHRTKLHRNLPWHAHDGLNSAISLLSRERRRLCRESRQRG